MKFNNILLTIITVCVFLVTTGGLYLGFLAVNRVDSQISTSIEEKVTQKVVPDKATVNFGVSFKNSDLAVANKSVKERVTQLFEILKKKGIAEEKIKTTENVYPDYDYSEGTPKIVGQNSNLNVTVVFEKLDPKANLIESISQELIAQKLIDTYNIGNYELSDPASICKELAKKSDAQAENSLREYSQKIKGFVLLKMEKTNENNCETQNRYYSPVGYSKTTDSSVVEKTVYTGENEYYSKTSLKIIYQIR